MSRVEVDHFVSKELKKLLAYISCKREHYQNASELLTNVLNNYDISDTDIDLLANLGQIYFRQGEIDKALNTYEKIFSVGINQKHKYFNMIIDCLLNIANMLNKQENKNVDLLYKCLILISNLDPENNIIKTIIENFESKKPYFFCSTGQYSQAIKSLEDQIKNKYDPSLLHLLAILYLIKLSDETDIVLRDYCVRLEKANIFWTSLSHDSSYWQNRFDSLKENYGHLSFQDYISLVSNVGLNYIDNLLKKLDDNNKDNTQKKELIGNTKLNILIERKTAEIISQIKAKKTINIPPGGAYFLKFIGKDHLLNQINSYNSGTEGWFLGGLLKDSTKIPFYYFLSYDYEMCLKTIGDSHDRELKTLKALAIYEQNKSLYEVGYTSDCMDLAQNIHLLPESYKSDAYNLLTNLAKRKFEELRKKDIDSSINFLLKILDLYPISELKDSLTALLLNRAAKKCEEGDINSFLSDYKMAETHSNDVQLVRKFLKKVVKSHLNKLISKNNFREAKDFLSNVKKQVGIDSMLESQEKLIEALNILNDTSIDAKNRVYTLIEEAYNLDAEDPDVRALYSISLTRRAIDLLNSITRYDSADRVKSIFQTSFELLKRAIEIDPNNRNARENFNQLLDIAGSLNILLSMRGE